MSKLRRAMEARAQMDEEARFRGEMSLSEFILGLSSVALLLILASCVV